MSMFVRGLIVLACALAFAACATAVVQEKATRFDQGVAAYDAGDFAQAYQIWSKLADENDLAAMRNTANLLRQGKGVAKDAHAAFKLYEEAAEKGLVTAMANVADMYLAGEGVARDPKAAAGWYARAGIAGLSLAQVRLADLYLQGTGVDKDPAKAQALLERAARNGYAPAQARLHDMGVALPLETPSGSSADDPWRGADSSQSDRARTRTVVLPAEQAHRPSPGDPITPDMISSMGADDAIVMKQGLTAYQGGNKVAAFASWREEAEKGVPEAETRIALLYARGEGTKRDTIEAYHWLRLAAAQGNAGAWVELPMVAAELSPAERAMGESLVRLPNGAQNRRP